MRTLPEITEALCRRIADGNIADAKGLAMQAAAKMGGARGERIQRAFSTMQPLQLSNGSAWSRISDSRSPWVHKSVDKAIRQWLLEMTYAQALMDSGERVAPLLLVGETRCGKTSSFCAVASKLGLPVYRLALASVVDSYMGGTASKMAKALEEMTRIGAGAIWLIDEIDGVAQHRESGKGAADKERAHAVATLLSQLDTLPSCVRLAATSNLDANIDAAILSRFTVVNFPAWGSLRDDERRAFAASHGDPEAAGSSYADTVQIARNTRIARIIAVAAPAPTQEEE